MLTDSFSSAILSQYLWSLLGYPFWITPVFNRTSHFLYNSFSVAQLSCLIVSLRIFSRWMFSGSILPQPSNFFPFHQIDMVLAFIGVFSDHWFQLKKKLVTSKIEKPFLIELGGQLNQKCSTSYVCISIHMLPNTNDLWCFILFLGLW